jgi:hypothetical protein
VLSPIGREVVADEVSLLIGGQMGDKMNQENRFDIGMAARGLGQALFYPRVEGRIQQPIAGAVISEAAALSPALGKERHRVEAAECLHRDPAVDTITTGARAAAAYRRAPRLETSLWSTARIRALSWVGPTHLPQFIAMDSILAP